MGQSTAGKRLEVWGSSEEWLKNNGKEGTEMDEQSVDYGNWVPKKMLLALFLLTSLFGAATFLPLHTIVRVLPGIFTLETDWGPMDLDIWRK